MSNCFSGVVGIRIGVGGWGNESVVRSAIGIDMNDGWVRIGETKGNLLSYS